MTELEIRLIIAKSVGEIGTLCEAARQWGISPAYLSDAINGRRGPGNRLLDAIGYECVKTVTYRKIKNQRRP